MRSHCFLEDKEYGEEGGWNDGFEGELGKFYFLEDNHTLLEDGDGGG